MDDPASSDLIYSSIVIAMVVAVLIVDLLGLLLLMIPLVFLLQLLQLLLLSIGINSWGWGAVGVPVGRERVWENTIAYFAQKVH